MLDSPTEALYHSLRYIYTPLLLKVINNIGLCIFLVCDRALHGLVIHRETLQGSSNDSDHQYKIIEAFWFSDLFFIASTQK